MKEYCIYIRHGHGIPYILDTFNNIDSAKAKLYDMVSLEELRQRPYFVDNDFFENSYNIQTKLKYFKILVRDITDWGEYSEKNKQEYNSNIIYFKNFQKSLTN